MVQELTIQEVTVQEVLVQEWKIPEVSVQDLTVQEMSCSWVWDGVEISDSSNLGVLESFYKQPYHRYATLGSSLDGTDSSSPQSTIPSQKFHFTSTLIYPSIGIFGCWGW